MSEPRETELAGRIREDPRLGRLNQELEDYKESEHLRAVGLRDEAKELSKKIRKLINKRDALMGQAKMRRAPIESLKKKISRRKKQIVEQEKRRGWRDYVKMFRMRHSSKEL